MGSLNELWIYIRHELRTKLHKREFTMTELWSYGVVGTEACLVRMIFRLIHIFQIFRSVCLHLGKKRSFVKMFL